jgi:hypothetical protein
VPAYRYTPNYDSLDCAAQWAKDTLNAHRNDKREFLYTRSVVVVVVVVASGVGGVVIGPIRVVVSMVSFSTQGTLSTADDLLG